MQIQLDKDPKIGVIWISKAYRTGRILELVRMFYKVIGKENIFLSRQQQQIDNSFDDLQYPGLRQIIPNFKEGSHDFFYRNEME